MYVCVYKTHFKAINLQTTTIRAIYRYEKENGNPILNGSKQKGWCLQLVVL